MKNLTGFTVLAAFAAASTASAQVLVDGFKVEAESPDPAMGEYAAETIRGQAPQIPGYVSGPENVWGGATSVPNVFVSSNFVASEGTLSLGNYETAGDGKVNVLGVSGSSGQTRYLVRNIEQVESDTFYFSGLVNRGSGIGTGDVQAPINADTFALTGFVNAGDEGAKLVGPETGAGHLFGLTWGFAANESADAYDLVVRHRRREAAGSSTIAPFNDVLLSDVAANTTLGVFFKFEFGANSPDSALGNDALTYWVGDASIDLTDEESATATALATGTLASFGLNTTSDLTRAIFAQRGYEASTAFFDENRYGTTFDSVTPALIPEPASLSLLGLGGLVLLRRRNK